MHSFSLQLKWDASMKLLKLLPQTLQNQQNQCKGVKRTFSHIDKAFIIEFSSVDARRLHHAVMTTFKTLNQIVKGINEFDD